eukprot:TRINITY_DN2473_c0_g1_i1.p1 TRINITY_DN2473_c0_g1~~TRINITY_DN2473_c0_g1_i1.p1  ORF type:complete len:1672 (+),score=534.32 TRINITY_DN2473_c0_g1_i1:83-5017(+)
MVSPPVSPPTRESRGGVPGWLTRRHRAIGLLDHAGDGTFLVMAMGKGGWSLFKDTLKESRRLTEPSGWDEARLHWRRTAPKFRVRENAPSLCPTSVLRRHGVCLRAAQVTLPGGQLAWLGVTTAVWAKLWLDTSSGSKALLQGTTGWCLKRFDAVAAEFAVHTTGTDRDGLVGMPPRAGSRGRTLAVVVPSGETSSVAAALGQAGAGPVGVAAWALRQQVPEHALLRELTRWLQAPAVVWAQDCVVLSETAPPSLSNALLQTADAVLLYRLGPDVVARMQRLFCDAPCSPGTLLYLSDVPDQLEDGYDSQSPAGSGVRRARRQTSSHVPVGAEAAALALTTESAVAALPDDECLLQCPNCGAQQSGGSACVSCSAPSPAWLGPMPPHPQRAAWTRADRTDACENPACGASFVGLARSLKSKNHCRACGKVFCGSCAKPDRIVLPEYGRTAQKACDACYSAHVRSTPTRVHLDFGGSTGDYGVAMLLARLVDVVARGAAAVTAARRTDRSGVTATVLNLAAPAPPRVFTGFDDPARVGEFAQVVLCGRRYRAAREATDYRARVVIEFTPTAACRAQAHLLRADLLRECECRVEEREGLLLHCPKCHAPQHCPLSSAAQPVCFACGVSSRLPADVDPQLEAQLALLPEYQALRQGGAEAECAQDGTWVWNREQYFSVGVSSAASGVSPLVIPGLLDAPCRLVLLLRAVRHAAAGAQISATVAPWVAQAAVGSWREGDYVVAPGPPAAGDGALWWHPSMASFTSDVGRILQLSADASALVSFGAAAVWYPLSVLGWAGPHCVGELRRRVLQRLAAASDAAFDRLVLQCCELEEVGRRSVSKDQQQCRGTLLLSCPRADRQPQTPLRRSLTSSPTPAGNSFRKSPSTPLRQSLHTAPSDADTDATEDTEEWTTWQCPNCGVAGLSTGLQCDSCGVKSARWRGPVPAGPEAAAARAKWARSDRSTTCSGCTAKLRRKHHCRLCGEAFCSDCCLGDCVIAPGYGSKLQRSCSKCYVAYLGGTAASPAPARVELQHGPDRHSRAAMILARRLLSAAFPSGVAVQVRPSDEGFTAVLLPRSPSDARRNILASSRCKGKEAAASCVEGMLRAVSLAVPLSLRSQGPAPCATRSGAHRVEVVIQHGAAELQSTAAALLYAIIVREAPSEGTPRVEEGVLVRCRVCSAERHLPSAGRCVGAALHDFGFGLAACVSCATPTLNRGCGACGHRLCPGCFAKHRAGRGNDAREEQKRCDVCGSKNEEVSAPHFVVTARSGGGVLPLVSAGPLDTPTRLQLVLQGVRKAAMAVPDRPAVCWRAGDLATLGPDDAGKGEVVATDGADNTVLLRSAETGVELWHPATRLRLVSEAVTLDNAIATLSEAAAAYEQQSADLVEDDAGRLADTTQVVVYDDAYSRYKAHTFVRVGDSGPAPDTGGGPICTFAVHTAPADGLTEWHVLKAPKGRGNWLAPADEAGAIPGGDGVVQGRFWAKRVDLDAVCPADAVYVRFRHAKLGVWPAQSAPDPSTHVCHSHYTDTAWDLLYGLEPATAEQLSSFAEAPVRDFKRHIVERLSESRRCAVLAMRMRGLECGEQWRRMVLQQEEAAAARLLSREVQQQRAAVVVSDLPISALWPLVSCRTYPPVSNTSTLSATPDAA